MSPGSHLSFKSLTCLTIIGHKHKIRFETSEFIDFINFIAINYNAYITNIQN